MFLRYAIVVVVSRCLLHLQVVYQHQLHHHSLTDYMCVYSRTDVCITHIHMCVHVDRHSWTAGLTGTQCCFGGYRTLLPPNSRGRQAQILQGGHTYEYGGVEARMKAALRSEEYARFCLSVVEAMGLPYGGHKTAPLIASWPGFDWNRLSPAELMHDSKIFLEMFLKVVVGKRQGSGFYNSWSYDDKHRREAQLLGIFRAIWPCNMGPLPWRLTRDQLKLLDARMGTLIWPQHVEKLCYSGASFWTKPDRMWKARRKIRLLYYILSTQLRDQVVECVYSLSHTPML